MVHKQPQLRRRRAMLQLCLHLGTTHQHQRRLRQMPLSGLLPSSLLASQQMHSTTSLEHWPSHLLRHQGLIASSALSSMHHSDCAAAGVQRCSQHQLLLVLVL